MKQTIGGFVIPLIMGVVVVVLYSAYPWANDITERILRGLLLATGMTLIAAAAIGLYIVAPWAFKAH